MKIWFVLNVMLARVVICGESAPKRHLQHILLQQFSQEIEININGPTDVLYNKAPVHVRKEISFAATRSTEMTSN